MKNFPSIPLILPQNIKAKKIFFFQNVNSSQRNLHKDGGLFKTYSISPVWKGFANLNFFEAAFGSSNCNTIHFRTRTLYVTSTTNDTQLYLTNTNVHTLNLCNISWFQAGIWSRSCKLFSKAQHYASLCIFGRVREREIKISTTIPMLSEGIFSTLIKHLVVHLNKPSFRKVDMMWNISVVFFLAFQD